MSQPLWLSILLLLPGCGEAGENTCDTLASSAEQSSGSEWLLLSAEQVTSIGRLSVGTGSPPLCTATVIGPGLAITADHCAQATTLTLESNSESRELPILQWFSHPVFDLAVLRFATEELPDDIIPLLPLSTAPIDPLEGTLVEAAGYGVTEAGTSGDLNFSVQRISAIEDDLALVLDAMGAWLACAGDSGGPVLLRDEQGAVRIAGVLSVGALDCMGQGRYLYLPGFADWLASVTGAADESFNAACGRLTRVGRCFGQGSVWCDAETLRVERCGADEQCGWDEGQTGFRCIAPELDPCSGVSEQGLCEDDFAVRCVEGKILKEDCLACGNVCGRSPATGLVECRSA